MHDALVGGNVDRSRQHLWIHFMKTITFLESVAYQSRLPGRADVVGGYLEICFKKKHNVREQKSTLCKLINNSILESPTKHPVNCFQQ